MLLLIHTYNAIHIPASCLLSCVWVLPTSQNITEWTSQLWTQQENSLFLLSIPAGQWGKQGSVRWLGGWTRLSGKLACLLNDCFDCLFYFFCSISHLHPILISFPVSRQSLSVWGLPKHSVGFICENVCTLLNPSWIQADWALLQLINKHKFLPGTTIQRCLKVDRDLARLPGTY